VYRTNLDYFSGRGTVGLLEDLVVAADFRIQGVGEKLLAETVRWTEYQGLKRLQLLADKNNLSALNLINTGCFPPIFWIYSHKAMNVFSMQTCFTSPIQK
jgi:GNAT superfamily N-acetyltransferase